MPLPPLPLGVEAAIRQFARQSQLTREQLMQIIGEALGTAAQQPEPNDPEFDDEDPDVIEADATINVPDEELNMHPTTDLSSRMTPRRARRLAKVRNMSGYKRVTSMAQRRRMRRQAAS